MRARTGLAGLAALLIATPALASTISVPEPGTLGVLGTSVLVGILWGRLRRTR